jgi:KUP system potassium uptake protein
VGFFTANLDKFYDGGWLPITVATLVFIVMLAWRHGREKLLKARWKDSINITSFLANIRPGHPIRVPGTGIFMVPNTQVVPLSLLHNLKHNHILHDRVILMTVQTVSIPYVSDNDRMEIEHLDHNFHIVKLRYGFFEEPKILRALAQLRIKEFHFKLADVSFFVGSENVISNAINPIEAISDRIFISLHRNMMTATEYFNIPPGHVVELGGQVKI